MRIHFTWPILFFALLLGGHAFGANDVKDLPPEFAPRLSSDEDKLKYLLEIQARLPSLFDQAMRYNIPLLGMLDDQRKLLNLLEADPKYLQGQLRRGPFLDITFAPLAETSGKSYGINSDAIAPWKKELLDDLSRIPGNGNFKEELISIIRTRVKEIAGRSSTGSMTGLIQILPTSSRKAAFQAKDIASKLAILERDLPDQILNRQKEAKASGVADRITKSEALANYRSLVEKEKELGRLLEIDLLRRYSSFVGEVKTIDDLRKKLQNANATDLAFILDSNVTQPVLKEISADLYALGQKTQLKELAALVELHSAQLTLAKEVVTSKVGKGIQLKEMPPSMAIFRGCTGGDCSSQMSFPYPNDPNERVYFIYDEKGQTKGYVEGTLVDAAGKSSFYLNCINGPRVSETETQLILNGFYSAREKLGVSQILIPQSGALNSLVNFAPIQTAFMRNIEGQTPIAIDYREKGVRSKIQAFKSNNHTASYDKMESNRSAIVYQPKIEPRIDVNVASPSYLSAGTISPHLTDQALLRFSLDLHFSDRQADIQRVLEIRRIPIAKLNEILDALSNKKEVSVEEYERQIKEIEKIERISIRPEHQLVGYLKSSDAFKSKNIEKSSQRYLQLLEKHDDPHSFDDWILLLSSQHGQEIETTQAFKAHMSKLKSTGADDYFIKYFPLIKLELGKNSFFDKENLLQMIQKIDQVNGEERFPSQVVQGLLNLASKDASYRGAIDAVLGEASQSPDVSIRRSVAKSLSYHWDVQPATLELFRKGLNDRDSIVLERVAQAMASRSQPAIFEIIRTAFQHPTHHGMKVAAAKALVPRAGEEANKLKLEALKDPDPTIHSEFGSFLETLSDSVMVDRYLRTGSIEKMRASALVAVSNLPDPDFYRFLPQVIKYGGEVAYLRAANRLALESKPEAVALLDSLLKRPYTKVRSEVLDLVGQVDPIRYLKYVKAWLMSNDPELHARIGQSLAKRSDRESFDLIRRYLRNNPRGSVKTALFLALEGRRDPKVEEIARMFVQDPNPEIRISAVLLVMRDFNSRDLPTIRAALQDPDAAVRRSAVSSLAFLKDKPHVVFPLLEEALLDPEMSVQNNAYHAIELISKDHPVQSLKTLKKAFLSSNDQLSLKSATSLGGREDRESLDMLSKQLKNGKLARQRLNAAVGLSLRKDASAFQVIREGFKSKDSNVRAALVRGVAHHAEAEGVRILESALTDTHNEVSEAAVFVIVTQPKQEYARLIGSLLKSPFPTVRAASVGLIEKAAHHPDLPTWLDLGLRDVNQGVRSAYRMSLPRINHPKATDAIYEILRGSDRNSTAQVVNNLDNTTPAATEIINQVLFDASLSDVRPTVINRLGYFQKNSEMGRWLDRLTMDELSRIGSQTLGERSDPESLALIEKLILSPDYSHRRVGISAFIMRKDAAALDIFEKLLRDVVFVQDTARILHDHPGPRAAKLLETLISHNDVKVREAGWFVLRTSTSEGYFDFLAKLAVDESAETRAAALQILMNRRDPRSIEMQEEMARNPKTRSLVMQRFRTFYQAELVRLRVYIELFKGANSVERSVLLKGMSLLPIGQQAEFGVALFSLLDERERIAFLRGLPKNGFSSETEGPISDFFQKFLQDQNPRLGDEARLKMKQFPENMRARILKGMPSNTRRGCLAQKLKNIVER